MIKLGEHTFNVPAPGGMRSFALQQRIIPVAGRVANVFLQLLKATGVTELTNIKALIESDVMRLLPEALPALGQIFASMPPGELEAITREMLRDATCDKKALFGGPAGDLFEGRMQGRTLDTWKLLWHALEAWYPDFFNLGTGLSATGAKATPSAESSTSTTSGPATA